MNSAHFSFPSAQKRLDFIMNVAFSGSAIEAWYKAVEKDIHFSQMDHLLLRIVAD